MQIEAESVILKHFAGEPWDDVSAILAIGCFQLQLDFVYHQVGRAVCGCGCARAVWASAGVNGGGVGITAAQVWCAGA